MLRKKRGGGKGVRKRGGEGVRKGRWKKGGRKRERGREKKRGEERKEKKKGGNKNLSRAINSRHTNPGGIEFDLRGGLGVVIGDENLREGGRVSEREGGEGREKGKRGKGEKGKRGKGENKKKIRTVSSYMNSPRFV